MFAANVAPSTKRPNHAIIVVANKSANLAKEMLLRLGFFVKVAELIAILKNMPQDAEVYYSRTDGFLDENMKYTYPLKVTNKLAGDIYDIHCEEGIRYNWSVRSGTWVEYKGVFFEIE
jgi:hypothetical protein